MFALNSSFSSTTSAKRHDVVWDIDCLVRTTIHFGAWERRLKVLNDKEGIDNENNTNTGRNRSMTNFEGLLNSLVRSDSELGDILGKLFRQLYPNFSTVALA
jgi:hypothetical protein